MAAIPISGKVIEIIDVNTITVSIAPGTIYTQNESYELGGIRKIDLSLCKKAFDTRIFLGKDVHCIIKDYRLEQDPLQAVSIDED